MKKLIILMLVLNSFGVYTQTLDVAEKKKALLFKSTASWCAPCGSYQLYNK